MRITVAPSDFRKCLAAFAVAGLMIGSGGHALAQESTPPSSPTPPTASTVTLPTPGMAGPLAFSSNPLNVDLGPAGKTYITGVVSGLGMLQSNAAPGNQTGQLGLSNAQLMLQKADGVVQYFVQVGAYSLPSLGTSYISAAHAVGDFFGAVPQAFMKLAPTSNFSIEAGKLPTLIGAEYTFSFENMNIERGLLWNQEPAISRGIQINYTVGPLAFAVSLNDGYYSGRLNWITGSVAWTLNSADTLTLVAGSNLSRTGYSNLAIPLPQNNGSIYNLIYTHVSGPWTITPYVQADIVPRDEAVGIVHGAATYGGAVLANYRFNSTWSLAGRTEFIAATGSVADGAPNLLYGPGSQAFSLTLTPTYQRDRFFARAELSYVRAFNTTPGLAFGSALANTNQLRGLIETGILF